MRFQLKTLALVSVAGLAAVLVAMGWQSRPTAEPPPGRIVADEPELLWRSPVVEPGRKPGNTSAQFRLTNSGGRDVTITSIESGCGCARPVPSATSIAPGRSITVDVEGKPFPIGDRTVAINVRTDSAAPPIIPLRLRMIGSHKPPFLLDAAGELTFLNVDRRNFIATGEQRKFVVRMLDLKSTAREPTFRVSPANLLVERISSATQPYVTPESVITTHIYQVSFVEPPIEDRLAGTVAVVDPWFPDHVAELRVAAEVRSRIRATPSRIDLASANGAEVSAEFLVHQ